MNAVPDRGLRGPLLLTGSSARELGALLFLSVMFPLLVHVVPVPADARLGPRLLPIFYAPLLAALWGRRPSAIALAILAPWLNRIVTGYPSVAGAVVMAAELLVFVGVFRWLAARIGPRWYHAAFAYLAAMAAATLAAAVVPGLIGGQAAIPWALRSIVLGLPGLGILLLINGAALRFYPPGSDDGASLA
jgi:hypothetical protein